jgi:hypothetical protein
MTYNWFLAAAVVASAPVHALDAPTAHLEFLWQARDRALDARPQALGLIARPPQPHQLCWKAQRFPVPSAETRLRVFDADGVMVIDEPARHASQRPNPVVCRDLQLDIAGAHYGQWRFEFYVDEALAGRTEIEVAESLDSAAFYRRTDRPYVVGRTNYPTGLAADEYRGHLLWQLSIDAAGAVVDVQTLEVAGIAQRLRERGDQAARLFRFPPDPARRAAPLVVRQRYDFATSH